MLRRDDASAPSRLRIRTRPRAVLVDLDDTIVDGSAVWTAGRTPARLPARVDPQAVLAEILKLRDWFWSDPERHRVGRLDLGAARQQIAKMALATSGATRRAGRTNRRAIRPLPRRAHGALSRMPSRR